MFSSMWTENYLPPMASDGVRSTSPSRQQFNDSSFYFTAFLPRPSVRIQGSAYPPSPRLSESPERMDYEYDQSYPVDVGQLSSQLSLTDASLINQPTGIQPEHTMYSSNDYMALILASQPESPDTSLVHQPIQPEHHDAIYSSNDSQPSLPDTSFINQSIQPEHSMYIPNEPMGFSMNPLPMNPFYNYLEFDTNMNERPRHENGSYVSEPEPEPESEPEPKSEPEQEQQVIRWVEPARVNFPEFPPVVNRSSDSPDGSPSSDGPNHNHTFEFIIEDPTKPSTFREKRVRSKTELQQQKEDIRQLKEHGGACFWCYKMKKKCGPTDPCPQCRANNRNCIRKLEYPMPTDTPESGMSQASTEDPDDVDELVNSMRTGSTSKVNEPYSDIDEDCDFEDE